MEPVTTATVLFASGACSLVGVAVAQDIGVPQQWTVLGLLAAVVLGGGKMLVQGVVKAIRDLGEDQRENTRVLSGLLTEIKLLSQQNTQAHADYARQRDSAVGEVLAAIDRMPNEVATELTRRKGA